MAVVDGSPATAAQAGGLVTATARLAHRVTGYLAVALVGLGLSFATGRTELLALAAPFAAAAALGLADRAPKTFAAAVELEGIQFLEGDRCAGTVVVERPANLSIEVVLLTPTTVSAVEPSTSGVAWRVPRGQSRVELPFRIRTDSWGRHRLGEVWVRARGPLGLVTWEAKLADAPELRVLPSPERLSRLLDPPAARASAGVHRSRRSGDGYEFAEVRQFRPGDQLRHLNWRATARVGEPQINRHHPERSGEVIGLIDTFDDAGWSLSELGQEALSRCARATWAVAQLHLGAQDRFGLMTHGRVRVWMHPAGGDQARYQLLESLLDVGGAMADRRWSVGSGWGAPRDFPHTALVVVFSPLWAAGLTHELERLASQGRSVVVVRLVLDDLLAPPQSAAEWSARWLWAENVAERARQLEGLGVPVVTWDGAAAISRVIAAADRVKNPVRVGRPHLRGGS